MSWYVYMLRCGDGSLYTGMTNDLEKRVRAHREGRGARYTRSRPPVTLVFHQRQQTRSAALKAEHQMKQLPRSEKLALVRRHRASARRNNGSATVSGRRSRK
jgi:putative endonuclease